MRWATALATVLAFVDVAAPSRVGDGAESISSSAFDASGSLPSGPVGDLVRYGEEVFTRTQDTAPKYVGNGLTCANCHLDRGRLASSAPMSVAIAAYPEFRAKSGKVDTLEDRIGDCFRFSMNGSAPEQSSLQMRALISYLGWLAIEAPAGANRQARGVPSLAKAERTPDIARGRQIYSAECALCHGAHGLGRLVGERYVFPPLWGAQSYNWGAGMHEIARAAAFIKANMPLGRGGSLADQDAWDVAAFVNSHPRPQDPRFTGDVSETRAKYHAADDDYYGSVVDGVLLGSP